MTSDPSSPYLLAEPPTSTGRILLARAFAHWCGLHYGHAPDEIAAAFDRADDADACLKMEVGVATRMMGELIASGRMRTYARPFGGAPPSPFPRALGSSTTSAIEWRAALWIRRSRSTRTPTRRIGSS